MKNCQGGNVKKASNCITLRKYVQKKATTSCYWKYAYHGCFKSKKIARLNYYCNKKAGMTVENFCTKNFEMPLELRASWWKVFLMVNNCISNFRISYRLTKIWIQKPSAITKNYFITSTNALFWDLKFYKKTVIANYILLLNTNQQLKLIFLMNYNGLTVRG